MKREKELVDKIRDHKALYYQGTPKISDEEYDHLEDELRKINPENAILFTVGTKSEGTAKVKHGHKMLSLGKTYKVSELKEWMGDYECISMHKIDGVSCSLIYSDGRLKLGKTRGDGSFGENITASVQWMGTVPSEIIEKKHLEIRGEIYCSDSDFNCLAEEMTSMELQKPTSQRNIVAGLISRKENIQLARHLSFTAFDLIGENVKVSLEEDKFSLLKDYGFTTPNISKHKGPAKVDEVIEQLKVFSEEGEYLVDGLVFSYNDIGLQRKLGETSHHPRYKQAFKFQGAVKRVKIKKIIWGVSRNGILTPVAEIDPVELSGALISRVTLHNLGVVETNNLKVGDEIELIRSGEVIPKFLRVTEGKKGEVKYPTVCPSCSERLNKEEIRLICINEHCDERQKQSLIYYIQKIGVENLSTKRVEQMMNEGLLRKISDLYELDVESLLKLESYKERLANKICESIEQAKTVPLHVFLTALGLSGGATNKVEKIIVDGGYNTLEKVLSLTIEKMVEIPSFAERSAEEFLKSLRSKRELIDRLVEVGVQILDDERVQTDELAGKKFCITGALTEKRSVIEAKIKNAGGDVVGSVSKKTDYLLTNETDSASSKYKKAVALSIKVITESELLSILEN